MTLSNANLPDIASESTPEIGGAIDRVGMSRIESMVRFRSTDEVVMHLPAYIDATVNLSATNAKGIHMSRLYLQVQKSLEESELSINRLKSLLTSMIETHDELSDAAFVAIEFKLPLKQLALKSELSGWRHFPIRIEGKLQNGKFDLRVAVRVTYSSTCPCSASLSRSLLAGKFEEDFDSHRWLSISSVRSWLDENGSIATPHSQRSYVDTTIRLNDDQKSIPVELLISEIETTLNTPVQAAVKRPDEQEFARLNGANLMFCEDAARRIKRALDELAILNAYHFRINHLESLHPHDAVAEISNHLECGVRFNN